MIIKDNVHGAMVFSELERKIIDSVQFQRLRKIKQIAFTYLVYPGATHTRFEHSLGTAHIAGEIAQQLGLDKDRQNKVRLAALLHDIGHPAFSHDGERSIASYIGNHEQVGKKIIEGLKDIIQENYSVDEILQLYNKPEGQIISSDLGADRMDYLLRDARSTGVAYGIIDTDRIIHTLRMEKNELCIDEGGLEAAESLLIARFMMFSTVYLHRTVRIAAAMLNRAIVLALKEKTVAPGDFMKYSDEEMLHKMQKGEARHLAGRLLMRNLYKEAYSLQANEKIRTQLAKLEAELSRKYNCQILVDYPFEFFKPIEIKVKTEDGLQPLIALSPLIKTLEQSENQRKKVLILCPKEKREAMQKEA